VTPRPQPGQSPQGKKRGGQPGNTNAFRHGAYADSFYERVLATAEQPILQRAQEMSADDLREEIALLRTRIRAFVEAAPTRIDTLANLMTTLCRLAATQYNMRGDQADRLVAAAAGIINDIRRTMGEDAAP